MKVEDAREIAHLAHRGQVDKIGVPYIEHVEAVAAGLAPFGPEMEMAGLLHDILEDTPWTPEALHGAGVPKSVIKVVKAVTNEPGVPYRKKILRISQNREATLVKIADNAHNSRSDRAAQLPEEDRERLGKKYQIARNTLWGDVPVEEIVVILSIVNPDLLNELEHRLIPW